MTIETTTRFREPSSNNLSESEGTNLFRYLGHLFHWFHDMSFRHATIAQSVGNCSSRDSVLVQRCFDTFFASGRSAKEASNANFEAACGCHASNCRGASLRSRGKRSGAIAFARSLQPVPGYPGPEARRGGSRYQAGGESQAGLSTADSRGGPR